MLVALGFLMVAVFMFLIMSKRATPAVGLIAKKSSAAVGAMAFMPSATIPPMPVPAPAMRPKTRTAAHRQAGLTSDPVLRRGGFRAAGVPPPAVTSIHPRAPTTSAPVWTR